MPTSKTNESMAVLHTISNLSATKVILDNKDLLPNLGCDIYDWMMKMICWIYSLIRWLRMGMFHLHNKEVEAPNTKRRHMEDNIFEMVRWVRIFFKDTYRCD